MKVGEDHIGNMVLGDSNLPDGLLVERVCTILIISYPSTVIGIQVVDTVGVGYGLCLHRPGVSGIPFNIVVATTGG